MHKGRTFRPEALDFVVYFRPTPTIAFSQGLMRVRSAERPYELLCVNKDVELRDEYLKRYVGQIPVEAFKRFYTLNPGKFSALNLEQLTNVYVLNVE